MKQAEILTLLRNGVAERTVATAIMAGEVATVLHRAANQVARAQFFTENAEWTEVLRLMEGHLEEEIQHATDRGGVDSHHPRTKHK